MRVALLISGQLRSFVDDGNWHSWVQHVVKPLEKRGSLVDTFLCTSSMMDGEGNVETNLAAQPHLVRGLNLRLWLQRERTFDFELMRFVLAATGCLKWVVAVWSSRKDWGRYIRSKYPAPPGFLRWLNRTSGSAAAVKATCMEERAVDLQRFKWRFPIKSTCARFTNVRATKSQLAWPVAAGIPHRVSRIRGAAERLGPNEEPFVDLL